jgi:hypothetical protein
MTAASRPKPRNWKIENLPGLSAENQTRLIAAGIETTLQLLQLGKTPQQRQQLAARLHIHIQHVNKWVALADLARVPSVGCQYCGLLLHSGISSTQALATVPLHRLHQQVLRFQVANMQRPDLCPSPDQVAIWIQEARLLGR